MRKTSIFLLFTLTAAGLFAGGAGETPSAAPAAGQLQLFSADVMEIDSVRIRASGLPADLASVHFSIEPDTPRAKAVMTGAALILKTDRPLEKEKSYTVSVTWEGRTATLPLNPSGLAEAYLNSLYSDKPLGYHLENGRSVFRVFVPRGEEVETLIFNKPWDPVEAALVLPMTKDGHQVFEAVHPAPLWGKYYGYRIIRGPAGNNPSPPEIPADTVFADPYSKAVAQSNTFPQKSRTLILDTSQYDWEGDKPLGGIMANTVILEAHIRDLTADKSAGAPVAGFKGMSQATRGGLKYIKDLGVNAVEFLPLMEFNNVEPPYKVASQGYKNTWNVYARNYWGYMTSNYFSPESYYGSDGTLDPDKWNGTDGRAVNEMKDMIKALHKEGIAVIMDVVFNHASSYDENPFKLMDKEYYFKKVDRIGTGNEVETRRPMVRRMVLDSVRYWMTEYHVDGFRFDLATSHDKETIRAVSELVYSLNPKALLIAEPWGGEGAVNSRDLQNAGFAIWNDSIRKAIRNENRPTTVSPNFALGTGGGAQELRSFWSGNTPGIESWKWVNYIESHDDATFGDNLRISSGAYTFQTADRKTLNPIADLEAYLRLSPDLLAAGKVGAAALFLAQGPVMIHLGQEWARGKVTPDLEGTIPELTTKGRMGASSDNVAYRMPTPNSYNADNSTNWINFDQVNLNRELLEYYKGLIRLRLSQPLLGGAEAKDITILENSSRPQSLGVSIAGKILGFVNADPVQSAEYALPEGTWAVMADKDRAGDTPLGEIQGPSVVLVPQSALIVIKKEELTRK